MSPVDDRDRPPQRGRRRGAPGGRRWFQLYCFRDEAITRALIDEAIDSGFEAIAADRRRPRGGPRERD